jgi:type I restriction enzyme S subunit
MANGWQKLTFKQTKAEAMVRIAASLIFYKLFKTNAKIVSVREITENVQYGYTEKSSESEIGPKYVRITDLKDGRVNWETVPYCKCDSPEQYLLKQGDLIFARTGATTGKTHLFRETPPIAVFASYLIRVRPTQEINPEYLYFFFQSDLYWSQISSQKEGSAQPNVNGQKLSDIELPIVDEETQKAICKFLAAVRTRQDGSTDELPELPSLLSDLSLPMERIETITALIAKAQSLRDEANRETNIILLALRNVAFDDHKEYKRKKLDNLCTIVRGSSPRPKGDSRFYGGNVPRLLIADISRDGKYVIPKIDSLTEEGAKLSRPMPKGSLVIAISGSYGVPAFLAVDACIHDGFIGFRDIDSSIDPEYLYQVLLLSKPYFDSVVKDSGLKNLTTSHLKNLDIPVPPLDEQRRIVAYLDSVQARLASLRELQSATGEELDALLPSVLDRAFKGEL